MKGKTIAPKPSTLDTGLGKGVASVYLAPAQRAYLNQIRYRASGIQALAIPSV